MEVYKNNIFMPSRRIHTKEVTLTSLRDVCKSCVMMASRRLVKMHFLTSTTPVKVWANTIPTESSQDDSQCEIAVSFLWVCLNVFVICHWERQKKLLTHSVSLLWDICEIIWWLTMQCSSELTVRVTNSRKAHSKLMLWVLCELDKYPQNELTVTHARWAFGDFHVSSQWGSCELKFLTG